MPLVAFSPLPTFERLMAEHHDVLPLDKAEHQDIRELHVGLLNMMPDATLQATERQFMRLVGDCNQIVQFYVHLFTIPDIPRSTEAQAWIDQYYETFDQVKEHGLDALIISGANPANPELEKESFWPMLTEVIDWAAENVTSTLCACLATHAVVQYKYGICRQPLPNKKWGVYRHRLTKTDHPLTRHTNTKFDVPHSRYNQITREQLEAKGLRTLAQSEDAGVHLATSEDGIRLVFFQGHPEYDDFSLLKEYKREIDRWLCGERADYPPFPENYFEKPVVEYLQKFKVELENARKNETARPEWPEEWLLDQLDNTWRDTALSTFNNWLGLVYQLTNKNPKLPFMEGVDPSDPLKGL
ncbi:homoserine O-succinyltransferase [Aliikangiella sp. G2MR2-5]|uniref:homoserine O-succinyltransferase MetA n=1 Tax=Aliikangiella sp. G2MR2-5 TaxID=2788943 RepID=UPI0018AA90F0|nr:homoserine O-succinyltransferase [Aliikangiella sp. G2MR2-5]